MDKVQVIFCWIFLVAALPAIIDAVHYSFYNWDEVGTEKRFWVNPHLWTWLWRLAFSVWLLHHLNEWVIQDNRTYFQYLLSLGLIFPLFHTGVYLQFRRWIDKPGPNYHFFGDVKQTGHWIANWVPDSIKALLIFLFEPNWIYRIIYAALGLILFLEFGWLNTL